jgi:S-adenosylmethionine uptake transporter
MTIFYFLHGIAYFNALKSDLSVVIPFRYTKLIFSGILSYLLFSETPDPRAYIGYALIIAAGLLLLYSEARKKRFAAASPAL